MDQFSTAKLSREATDERKAGEIREANQEPARTKRFQLIKLEERIAPSTGNKTSIANCSFIYCPSPA